jgi:hypothetical protein
VIIALAGLKGSGKDYAGQYLVEEHGFTLAKFAAPLYDSAAAVWDVPASLLDALKNEPRARIRLTIPKEGTQVVEECIRDYSIREYLQRYGTEAHRDVFGPSFWTDQLMQKLAADPDGRYVVTDARFENECRAIKEAGGRLYYIERDGVLYGETSGDSHASETPPPEDTIDAYLTNITGGDQMLRHLDAIVENVAWEVPA